MAAQPECVNLLQTVFEISEVLRLKHKIIFTFFLGYILKWFCPENNFIHAVSFEIHGRSSFGFHIPLNSGGGRRWLDTGKWKWVKEP